MLNSQKIQLRLSEAREANARCDCDSMSDAEIQATRDAVADLEKDYRAAIAAEGESNRRAAVDGEGRELDGLAQRAQVRSILDSVLNDGATDGAERELQQAVDLPGDGIPWRLLADVEPVQERADADAGTPTTIGSMQRPIIERVFARSALRALGVEMPSVPTGDMLNYVVTAGAPGSFADGVAAVDASAYTLSPFELQPRRLSAGYLIKEEDVMRVKGYEPALRSDLRRALSNRLDAQTLGLGNSTVRGFLATAANGGLAARAAPSDTVTYLLALVESALGVDGIYAGACSELTWVVGDDTYRKLAALLNTGSGETFVEHATHVLRRLRSSANIPAVASNVQEGIIAKMGQGMSHATAPVWGGGPRIIRDEVTKANTGQVRFTVLAFYNFRVLRPTAFQRTSLKVT